MRQLKLNLNYRLLSSKSAASKSRTIKFQSNLFIPVFGCSCCWTMEMDIAEEIEQLNGFHRTQHHRFLFELFLVWTTKQKQYFQGHASSKRTSFFWNLPFVFL